MDPARLERAIGYQFTDGERLTRALTHRSRGSANNERLEFLGDSLLGFVVSDLLFERFPEEPEGVLSRLRASLVNQGALASHARRLELGQYIFFGPGELKSGAFDRDSILSDAYESLLGAVYLDGGYGAARTLIENEFQSAIAALVPADLAKDPKTRLQETLQQNAKPLPRYEVVEVAGPPHDRRFTVHCHVNGLDEAFEGRGLSRREAEQAAAREALEGFNELLVAS